MSDEKSGNESEFRTVGKMEFQPVEISRTDALDSYEKIPMRRFRIQNYPLWELHLVPWVLH